MGLFDFLKKKKESGSTPEYLDAVAFNKEFSSLLSQDVFLARSDYKHLVGKYAQTFTFFESVAKAQMLKSYCKQNRLDAKVIELFISTYADIKDLAKGSTLIKKHNDEFVRRHCASEKGYLDKILYEVDPKIILDDEQRTAVLSDEDYTLIVAGAGAGKTTTVAAKVRYLVEKKHIDPKQILVISFTNKAVGELQERINDQLKIPCPITTFHKTGNAILRKQEEEKKKVVTEGFLYNTINNYLKGNILNQPELVDKLIMFFGSYFTAPYEGDDIKQFFNYIAKTNFSSLRADINEYSKQIIDRRTNKITTITNETLRSAQEVQIANFLYMHGIDYVYEETYPYNILKAQKPYTPDFCIRQGDKVAYIEHFGINEDGTHSFYTKEQLARYKREMIDKIKLHKQHNTKLLYTFSSYRDGRDLLTHLRELLEEAGFELVERSSQEVYEKLVNTEENTYILKLVKLVCTFINNFKTNGYTLDDFYRMDRSGANPRTKLFLEICKECYLEYQKKLAECNSVDFQDMINDAARILREKQITNEQLDFKYIIVDEYQDISYQRFDLTKELSKTCTAKIIAVGDDWQSIYTFSGSDITLFTHFCSIMGYGQELKITKTYRNAQEVIDIAGNFIQKNDTQIKKSLVSPLHIQRPVIIYSYSEKADSKEYKGKGGKYFNLGKKLEEVIGQILKQNQAEGKGKNSTILLIGRYGFDARNLCYSQNFVYDEYNNKIFCKKYPQAKLEFMTAHSSKGLGFDNVIIVNARNEVFGFPSQIQDDPVMKYVTRDDLSIEYAEERRLFYVAMTRTKNRVYIIAPEQRPSRFIVELLRDYKNVLLIGNLNQEESQDNGFVKRCPICGFPLQLRYNKNFGLRLWMCTNEPELCTYLTNEIGGGIMSIQKCDCCRDGYLIVKRAKDSQYILGCTNYKSDKTGCNRYITQDNYQVLLSRGFEVDSTFDKPSYLPEIVDAIPKLTETKRVVTTRKKAEVNSIEFVEHFVEKEGFNVVATEDGTILTDMELLKKLRALRLELAKEIKRPAFCVMSNSTLVSLATYRPTTKEQFLNIKGVGEVLYSKYGEKFIEVIKKHGEDYL